MPRSALLSLATLALALTACDPAPDNSQATPAPTAAAPAPVAPAAPALDKTALQDKARNVILVPSPTEMQNALVQAGISDGLSGLVGDRTIKLDSTSKDVISVRTGAALAYALLTVKDADTAALVKRLDNIKAGMTALGAGTDINATIDDIEGRLNSDSLSRDDLLAELDELHGAIIPEISYEAGNKVVPLIKAGSWLAGVNLVSQAVLKAGDAKAGTKLLQQPDVADYFLTYVHSEGAAKAPPEVIKLLEATLTHLKELSAKPELSLDEIKDIQSQTAAVLALL